MTFDSRFCCPACGFLIYNRRVAKCESCGNVLPVELLLSEKQIADLNTEFERSRKIRAEQLQRDRHKDKTWGGEGSFDGDGGDGGGD